MSIIHTIKNIFLIAGMAFLLFGCQSSNNEKETPKDSNTDIEQKHLISLDTTSPKPAEVDSVKDNSYYISKGKAKEAQMNFKEAIGYYTKAMKVDSSDFYPYSLIGGVYFKLEDYHAALRDYNKAISLNKTKMPIAYDYKKRADTKYHLEDYKSAICDYDTAIKNTPESLVEVAKWFPETYFDRGMAKLKFGEHKGACSDFNKAIDLGNPNAIDAIKKYCQ